MSIYNTNDTSYVSFVYKISVINGSVSFGERFQESVPWLQKGCEALC